MTAQLPEPEQLRGRLGREEFAQKLLACLVLGRMEMGWNIPRRPSDAGVLFLRALHRSAFADASPSDEVPDFVDEFELPRRVDAEPSGWPDYGVVWPGRLLLIELKTERAGHRAAQIPYYLELAAYWHGTRDVDLLYLTPTMPLIDPAVLTERHRFQHLTWAEVAPLIDATWSHSDVPAERQIASYLLNLINEIEAGETATPSAPPAPAAASVTAEAHTSPLPPASPEDIDEALALAAQTESDGRQRGLDSELTGPADLDALRLELRDRLMTGPTVDGVGVRHVLPWLWRAATSGGQALTRSGEESGYELRVSRYERDVTTA